MRKIFDILVGLAVIAGTVFTALTWGLIPPQGGIKAMLPANWLSWNPQTLAVLGVIVLISTWILIAVRMGWIGATAQSTSSAFSKWPDPYKPTVVVGKTFRNEIVPLDVTLLYNGTTPFQLSGSEFYGYRIRSENPAVNGAFILAKGLDLLPATFEFNVGPNNIVEPLKHVP